MSSFTKAIVSLPDTTRQPARTLRGPAYIIATAVETNGAIGMFEVVVPPGKGPTRHTHTREVEVFRVIEGHFRFWCGDEQSDAPTGTTVTLPPHVPHHWKNVGDGIGRPFAIVAPAASSNSSSTSPPPAPRRSKRASACRNRSASSSPQQKSRQ